MMITEYIKTQLNEILKTIQSYSIRKIMLYIVCSGLITGLLLGLLEIIERSYSLGYFLSTTNKLQGMIYNMSDLAITGIILAIFEALLFGILLSINKSISQSTKLQIPWFNLNLLVSAGMIALIITIWFYYINLEGYNHSLFNRYILQTSVFQVIVVDFFLLILSWFIAGIATLGLTEDNLEKRRKVYLTSGLVLSLLTLLTIHGSGTVHQLSSTLYTYYLSILELYNNLSILAILVVLMLSIVIMYLILFNTLLIHTLAWGMKAVRICIITLLFFIYGSLYLFITHFLFTHFYYDVFIREIQFMIFLLLFFTGQFITFILMKSFGLSLKRFSEFSFAKTSIVIVVLFVVGILVIEGFHPSNNVLKAFSHRYLIFHSLIEKTLFDASTNQAIKNYSLLPENPKCTYNSQISDLIMPETKLFNIVLISIDTLRYDITKDKSIMPALNSLRKDSYTFSGCYSHGTHTITSISSLNTSQYFASITTIIPETFAEILLKKGYKTAAFSGNNYSTEKVPMISVIIDKISYYTPIIKGYQTVSMPGMDIEYTSKADAMAVQSFNKFLHNYSDDAPFLAWINLFRPHEVPATFAFQSLLNKIPFEKEYLKRVKEADQNLGKMIKTLKETDLYESSLIIVFSDHGEEIMDHGGLYHKYSLYNEIIRVPLFIKLPYQKKHHVIENPVSLLDIYPTILHFLNYPLEELNLCGDSLLPAMFDLKEDTNFPISAMIIGTTVNARQKPFPTAIQINDDPVKFYYEKFYKISIVDNQNKWKLIYTLSPEYFELYDLQKDPAEKVNMADDRKDIVYVLYSKLKEQTGLKTDEKSDK